MEYGVSGPQDKCPAQSTSGVTKALKLFGEVGPAKPKKGKSCEL